MKRSTLRSLGALALASVFSLGLAACSGSSSTTETPVAKGKSELSAEEQANLPSEEAIRDSRIHGVDLNGITSFRNSDAESPLVRLRDSGGVVGHTGCGVLEGTLDSQPGAPGSYEVHFDRAEGSCSYAELLRSADRALVGTGDNNRPYLEFYRGDEALFKLLAI